MVRWRWLVTGIGENGYKMKSNLNVTVNEKKRDKHTEWMQHTERKIVNDYPSPSPHTQP